MDERSLITAAEAFVRQELAGDAGGHDWWHVDRVRRLALRLAREEGADPLVVELAALLHDVADFKVSGSEEAGALAAREWLTSRRVEGEVVERVVEIVRGVSFKGAGIDDPPLTVEGECVRDADRLDALGAIGIARAFAYGGSRGQPLHEPDALLRLHADAAEYRRGPTSTINHFHEKLLLLRDRMRTGAGRRVAEGRHEVMERFLAEFEAEWQAGDGGYAPEPALRSRS